MCVMWLKHNARVFSKPFKITQQRVYGTLRSRGGEPIDEQTLSRYRHKKYYPMRIGETIKDRYHIITKLGYGAYSTVWLARDKQYAPP